MQVKISKNLEIHKEGYPFLIGSLIFFIFLNELIFLFYPDIVIFDFIILFNSLGLYLFFIHFFIRPNRVNEINDHYFYSPADGEIVVIEETLEHEYFDEKRLQVSIFMSPFDYHVNWVPVNGIVSYYKYHPGDYLVAYHPKCSLLNERATTVIKTKDNKEYLLRQVAGILARKISTYPVVGQEVKQNEEMGFIKFGSRVDIFFPIGTKLNIKIGDKVKGNKNIIALIE